MGKEIGLALLQKSFIWCPHPSLLGKIIPSQMQTISATSLVSVLEKIRVDLDFNYKMGSQTYTTHLEEINF